MQLEPTKKTINCLKCNKEIRIPSFGEVNFSCPHCHNKFKYKNGEPSLIIISYNTKDSKQSDQTKKSEKRNSTLINPYYIVIPILLLLLTVNWYWEKEKSSEKNYFIEPTKESNNTGTPFFGIQSPLQQNENSDSDSLANEKLKDQMLDLTKDISQEILEELIDKLLNDVEEKANNEEWKKANDSYNAIVDLLLNKGQTGSSVLKKFQDKLVRIKKRISENISQLNDLPESIPINKDEIQGELATETIFNQTEFVLILYYSGFQNKIISIPPYSSSQVSFQKGIYKIIAKVNAPNILEYSGIQEYKGVHYSSSYKLINSQRRRSF